jgi:hypothetical protein
MATVQEVIDSLTGFEEMGIAKATGQGLEAWADQGRRLVTTRAVASVLLARSEAEEGKTLTATEIKGAWDRVQAMNQTEVSALFEDEEPEVFPEEPVTEQGKDDSQPSDERESSPGSASEQE